MPAWHRATFSHGLIYLGKKLLRNPEFDRDDRVYISFRFFGAGGMNKLVDVLGRSWFFSDWHLFDLIMMSA
jgi:hypothetical protein